MDTARYARFERPGHRATGDRSQRCRNWMADSTQVRYDFAHAIVDDHSRLAYIELLYDEKAATRHRVGRPRTRVAQSPGHQSEVVDDRQRLKLHAQQLAAQAADRSRH